MKHVLLCLAVLTLSLGIAWAVEAPTAPEALSTPAAPPILDFTALSGARYASEPITCFGPAGYTCTEVTSCDPVRSCSNQTGTGPIKTRSCRCCIGFPPSCTTTVMSVSCGC